MILVNKVVISDYNLDVDMSLVFYQSLTSVAIVYVLIIEDNGEYPRIGRVGSHNLKIGISFYFLEFCSNFPKTMFSI